MALSDLVKRYLAWTEESYPFSESDIRDYLDTVGPGRTPDQAIIKAIHLAAKRSIESQVSAWVRETSRDRLDPDSWVWDLEIRPGFPVREMEEAILEGLEDAIPDGTLAVDRKQLRSDSEVLIDLATARMREYMLAGLEKILASPTGDVLETIGDLAADQSKQWSQDMWEGDASIRRAVRGALKIAGAQLKAGVVE